MLFGEFNYFYPTAFYNLPWLLFLEVNNEYYVIWNQISYTILLFVLIIMCLFNRILQMAVKTVEKKSVQVFISICYF